MRIDNEKCKNNLQKVRTTVKKIWLYQSQSASIFRDTRYETFRIIYLKENYIAGYESVSTKTPTNVDIFYKYRKGRSRCERCFYKIADRKNRLQADSYYLVHNHPSDNAKASSEDLKLTQEFSKKIKGFK